MKNYQILKIFLLNGVPDVSKQMNLIVHTQYFSVMLEIYELNWCVIDDTLSVSHENMINLIYFDTFSSSLSRKIIKNLFI